MAIVKQSDVTTLIEGWIRDEAEGNRFPVPFDIAWTIAGYSRKDSAKRYLPKAYQGELYHVCYKETAGRPLEEIWLSFDGFKHVCLMADTEMGHQTRQYFIEAEKAYRSGVTRTSELFLRLRELEAEAALYRRQAAQLTKEAATIIKEIEASGKVKVVSNMLALRSPFKEVTSFDSDIFEKILRTKRGQTIEWQAVKSLSRGDGRPMLRKKECLQIMESIAKCGQGKWLNKKQLFISC